MSQTFTKVYACVAVIFCGPHMPCPFIIFTSICSPLRTTPLINTSKTVPCPNIDIISWHLYFVFNIKGNSNQSFLTLPSVHLRSSCCLCKHKTNISLSQRGIYLCDRLMEICVFRNKQVALGLHYSKEWASFGLFTLRSFSENQGSHVINQDLKVLSCAEKFVVSTTNVLPPP